MKRNLRYYRYDIIGADVDYGIKMRPKDDMKRMGFDVRKSEASSFGECWFFMVTGGPDVIPGYLHEISCAPFSDDTLVSHRSVNKKEEFRLLREYRYRTIYPPIWKKDGTLTDYGMFCKKNGTWKTEYDDEKIKYTVEYYGEIKPVKFEIYFSDLNEDAQKRLLIAVGAESPEEMNWDLDIIPLAVFEFEEIDD